MVFIASTTNQDPIQKASMMFLSKKTKDKDQSLKMQMMLSLDKDDSSNSQKIWKKMVFLEIKNVIVRLRNQASLKTLFGIL